MTTSRGQTKVWTRGDAGLWVLSRGAPPDREMTISSPKLHVTFSLMAMVNGHIQLTALGTPDVRCHNNSIAAKAKLKADHCDMYNGVLTKSCGSILAQPIKGNLVALGFLCVLSPTHIHPHN